MCVSLSEIGRRTNACTIETSGHGVLRREDEVLCVILLQGCDFAGNTRGYPRVLPAGITRGYPRIPVSNPIFAVKLNISAMLRVDWDLFAQKLEVSARVVCSFKLRENRSLVHT